MSKTLWKDSPSQISNFWTYVLFWWTIILPIIAYLKTRFTSYEMDSERFRIKKGILNQNIEETELYRIKDYSIFKPFFLRIFGLGHLALTTSDKNNKYVRILAIKEVEKLKDMIRNEVEKRRKATGTKEVDFE
ncbi:PH domain-containing protein [Candidatus Pelagibacter bacterium]|nr:PH domain-containing protein [Candidatus Pelagibacter bacterium]MDA8800737.1 PH domain-containing protein [Candidatus Pelagibacter bacterium]